MVGEAASFSTTAKMSSLLDRRGLNVSRMYSAEQGMRVALTAAPEDSAAVLEVCAGLLRSLASDGLTLPTASAESDRPQKDALLAEISQLEELARILEGITLVRTAQFASIEATSIDGELVETVHPLGWCDEFDAVELAAVTGHSDAFEATRMHNALDAVTLTPRLVKETCAGRLDPYRLRLVVDEVREASAEACAAVEETLLERDVADWTRRQIRTRIRAQLRSLEPPAVTAAAAAKFAETIAVTAYPHHVDGLSEIHAIVPTMQAAAIMAAIEEHAKQLHRDDATGQTLGQCRANALHDLLLANAQTSTHVTLLVPVETPNRSDRSTGDVVIPGIGVVTSEGMSRLGDLVGKSVAIALVDAASGSLVRDAAEATRYRPSAQVLREVRLRDQHCRFPGCQRPAAYCDADHVTPWPDGETVTANLQSLCRHHHRAKHEAGWRVTMDDDGLCRWTSPTGQVHVTQPGIMDLTRPPTGPVGGDSAA